LNEERLYLAPLSPSQNQEDEKDQRHPAARHQENVLYHALPAALPLSIVVFVLVTIVARHVFHHQQMRFQAVDIGISPYRRRGERLSSLQNKVLAPEKRSHKKKPN
jgi:hypothetical protein